MTAVALPEPVQLERPPVDWERHKGDKRPKILPPPGVTWKSASGKTKQRHRYYTRVTTYADAISDQYNLGRWRMRRVALGAGQRQDYVRLASALTDRDDDRDALDELVDKMLEAAGPNKADEGTALHALTERIDRGEDLGNPPPEFIPDLTAYEVLSGELFRFVHREARTVCDQLECAGTPDGHAVVGELPPTDWGPKCDCPPDVLRIVDTKTGSVRYPAKMSIQLAIYAHSDLYDPATGERIPVRVCPHWGVIVHLPVETGLAAPFWIDLERGWRGAELCGPVREWNRLGADEVLVPFQAHPVKVDAAGTIDRPEPRLASHNDKAGTTPAPVELTDLSDALAASIEAVRSERLELIEAAAQPLPNGQFTSVGADGAPRDEDPDDYDEREGRTDAWYDNGGLIRCRVTDLVVDQCACRVHRPDLADVGDDGARPEPEPGELPPLALRGRPAMPGMSQPPTLPDRCAHSDRQLDRDTRLPRCRDCGEWLTAPRNVELAQEILAQITDRDLELLWRKRREEWTQQHLKLATERVAALKADTGWARPRAAMRAAIETAGTLEALTGLMVAHRDDEWMTPELFQAADARFWHLKGAPERARREAQS